ncbi:S66 peptidase family protein [Bacillus rubiinfantis]|uniref:S66 peptidase family protein n=1 Tax=Bacillus rubiinfantis TaxID=1499680 RepID=UPI0005A95393|nr:LD-carboxypeptidase [Bacillus rubiinfantis]
MECIKPVRLQAGDTVGVIAPASPPKLETLERGIQFLSQLGLHVAKGKHLLKVNGYLAGNDAERLEDLHSMFLDESIKAVICACGGYGTARIADYVNYEIIRNNPKIFWGYSDVTFLHSAIHQKTGLVTFHGPMLASDIGKVDVDIISKEGFSQLFHPAPIVYNEDKMPLEVLIQGKASGPITGGNLSLLVSSLGTNFEIDTNGKLFFIEEVNEEPRVIDRMLNQLFMTGKLQKASGLLFGQFSNCVPRSNPSLSTDEVIAHYVTLANRPAVKGLQIGHCNPHFAVPLGAQAVLDTNKKKLIIESGVI